MVTYYTHMHVENWTQSTVIGGSSSQNQAKLIDFLTSAIAAPLVLALLNYVAFRIAQVCVLDADAAASTFSLKALVEVGTTTFGSYDPFKFATLVATSKVRVMLLAIKTVLSALSFSTLTNVIAYEAFQADVNEQSLVGLAYLYSPPGQSAIQKNESSFPTFQMPEISSNQQLSEFTSQYFKLMTQISFATAADLLDDGKYTGINATNASLNAVPAEVGKSLAFACISVEIRVYQQT